MADTVIIVESPTKAKTIKKFLGERYQIIASFGHVRDLPNNASQVPESKKALKWSRLGINVDENYTPLYIIPPDKTSRVADLKKAVKEAKEIYLATDEDREGESISWHLVEVLAPKIPVKRLVFHEITKAAIEKAIKTPRDIDLDLVKAQETRRIVDRLFGYTVSPLLWKKMAPKLSAGRVQSVAIRILSEREHERMQFCKGQYWGIQGIFSADKDSFQADLIVVGGKRVAIGKDFNPSTGKVEGDVVLLTEESCKSLVASCKGKDACVVSVENKPFTDKPAPPFTTSTLQQEASRKLGYTVKRTMQVAQQLYENGMITYMRTDSTFLSEEAVKGARDLILNNYGKNYLSPEVRVYKTKVKNAQEAHEAIRPSGNKFADIKDVHEKFGKEAGLLYELIWKRTVACQMANAEGNRLSVKLDLEGNTFRASGKTISFPGFLRAYVEGTDDPELELADKEKLLPPLKEGEKVKVEELKGQGHETQPPNRYTEAALIKQLETLGIGRPSTWATIVDVVLNRGYAFKRGNTLVPTFLALGVTKLMTEYFPKVVDYQFTANLEELLDEISRGELNNLEYLESFYRGDKPGLLSLVEEGDGQIDPRVVCELSIPAVKDSGIEVRIGRYGPFISLGEARASLPADFAPDELNLEHAKNLLGNAKLSGDCLGVNPETGANVFLKAGRFGPYVEEEVIDMGSEDDLQDTEEEEVKPKKKAKKVAKPKPKRASLLKGMSPEEVDLECALKLLSLPRNLGKWKDEEVFALNGPYGPYVKAGSTTRPLEEGMSPLDVTLEQATTLLESEPKRKGRGASSSAVVLGEHPDSGKKISIKSGRFGHYVTDGKVNASLGKGITEITLEEAVTLINEKIKKMNGV